MKLKEQCGSPLKTKKVSFKYDSEVFGFPVESFRTIVPVSSRSGSNYGFVAAHWPPRRYRANRVPLSHANSPATAVIASRRGLTSNTSWLVFSRTVGVSPLSLTPRTRRASSRHTSLVVLLGASLFLHFLSSAPPRSSVPDNPDATVRPVSLSLSQFLRMVVWSLLPTVPTRRAPRYPARARASMSERYPHPVGPSCLPLSAHTPVATENQLVMLASFSARRKTAIC